MTIYWLGIVYWGTDEKISYYFNCCNGIERLFSYMRTLNIVLILQKWC